MKVFLANEKPPEGGFSQTFAVFGRTPDTHASILAKGVPNVKRFGDNQKLYVQIPKYTLRITPCSNFPYKILPLLFKFRKQLYCHFNLSYRLISLTQLKIRSRE